MRRFGILSLPSLFIGLSTTHLNAKRIPLTLISCHFERTTKTPPILHPSGELCSPLLLRQKDCMAEILEKLEREPGARPSQQVPHVSIYEGSEEPLSCTSTTAPPRPVSPLNKTAIFIKQLGRNCDFPMTKVLRPAFFKAHLGPRPNCFRNCCFDKCGFTRESSARHVHCFTLSSGRWRTAANYSLPLSCLLPLGKEGLHAELSSIYCLSSVSFFQSLWLSFHVHCKIFLLATTAIPFDFEWSSDCVPSFCPIRIEGLAWLGLQTSQRATSSYFSLGGVTRGGSIQDNLDELDRLAMTCLWLVRFTQKRPRPVLSPSISKVSNVFFKSFSPATDPCFLRAARKWSAWQCPRFSPTPRMRKLTVIAFLTVAGV